MKLRNIPFSPPDMTEAEVEQVAEALHSGWITTGPKTKEFEKLIALVCSSQKVVCLNSATAAMEMALRLIDVGPEDEVIVPAYTYTATASVTQHVGCKVVMVDSQKDNVEMDYDKLADAIAEHTKVIMPVDLGGIICDFDKVFEIVEAKKHLFHPTNAIQKKIGRIIVAADDAHAFGAKRNGKMAGEIADFSSFSFHAVKNLTTAEGGALTWNLPFGKSKVESDELKDYKPTVPYIEGETWDELLYRLSQLYSLHGQNKDALAKTQLGAWEYDIIGPWYKCNMTDVVAGIGLAQLKRYPEMLYRRRQMIGRYNEAIDKLNANLDATHQVKYLNHYGENHSSSGHLYITRLLGRTDEERRAVIIEMAKRGIACKDYPNAYHLFENEITLPLHTKLTDEDVEYVISNFVDIIKNL